MAAISGYGRRWIGVIVHRYNEKGLDGLGDHRGKNAGAKPLLDKEGEAVLKTVLAELPADGGLWTGPKVAAWMSDPARPQGLAAAGVGLLPAQGI